jgi:hypothetical protein
MSSRLHIWIALSMWASLSGCNCKATPITRVAEDYKIVPGSPSVQADTPSVNIQSLPPPATFEINVPRQCDIFNQNAVRNVDILWVVDSSGSMGPHQAQLAANFSTFINYLLSADPPIDFHIGVVTTDVDDTNEQGRLHGWNLPGVAQGNFIACDQNHNCNTAPSGGDPSLSVAQAFSQMSQVGILGSSVERGLYATYLALNRSDNMDVNGDGSGFIRSGAALYVVAVSDEDDSSCSPTVGSAAPGDSCRCDPGCHCADDPDLVYGTAAFYSNFLQTYKGYGHSDLVAFSAITGTEKLPVPAQFGDPNPHEGCTGTLIPPDGGAGQQIIAYYGKRYIDVATATGGVATSICSSDFNAALTALSFTVSGLRSEFKLSRGPDPSTITIFEADTNATPCTYDNECVGEPNGANSCQAGQCSRPVSITVQPSPSSAQYERCENGVLRNVISFGTGVIPPALSTVEVCYNVDAHFNPVCQ